MIHRELQPQPLEVDAELTNRSLDVVLVEDVPSEGELIARALKRGGLRCVVRRVEDEAGFRRALGEHVPDLILSDFTLPKFDGLAALELARSLAPNVPFIFVSGTIGEERAIGALQRGATDYVLKTNLRRLPSAAARALREAATQRARHSAEQALRESERRLRDIVSTSQDWIWEQDARGRFTFSSDAVIRILGHPPDALLGVDFRDLLHPDDRNVSKSLLPGADGGPIAGVVACWRAADGQYRWLERSAVALVDQHGETAGYRGIERDVTLRRRHEQRLKRLSRSYRMLSHTNSAIIRLPQRAELLAEICRIVVRYGGYARTSVYLLNPGLSEIRPIAFAGISSPSLDELTLPVRDPGPEPSSMTARALRCGAPIICNDLRNDTQAIRHRETLLGNGLRSAAVLPLVVDGTPIGTCNFLSADAGVFDDEEIAILSELAANVSFALQYFAKEDTVQFLSWFDAATGLPKRALFCERLGRFLAPSVQTGGGAMTVIVFDVERLSAVNDAYGRHIGDQLLARIAARLRRHFDDTDSIAHFGGGTFAAMAVDVHASGETGHLQQNAVAQLFTEPFVIEDQEIVVAVRSGIAYFPHDGTVANQLVQNAETALKVARDGGEKYAVFGFITRPTLDEAAGFEARLAGALEREQFLLYYQPKIEVESGRLLGFEALLRWQDVRTGLVSPAVFVPILERTGLIVDVGRWVIEEASRSLHSWYEGGLGRLRVAVNVSPRQLRHRDFVDHILAIIAAWDGVGPGLDVEITESLLMHNLKDSTAKLERLKSAGVGIALDDFGTGYSSLRLLSHLPVDTLKIDRSFIDDIANATDSMMLITTIISLARSLGMTTVAEGVETDEQLRMLRLLKCAQAQGYLISPPVPAAQVPALIQRFNAVRGSVS